MADTSRRLLQQIRSRLEPNWEKFLPGAKRTRIGNYFWSSRLIIEVGYEDWKPIRELLRSVWRQIWSQKRVAIFYKSHPPSRDQIIQFSIKFLFFFIHFHKLGLVFFRKRVCEFSLVVERREFHWKAGGSSPRRSR